jgi:hypothetical protein
VGIKGKEEEKEGLYLFLTHVNSAKTGGSTDGKKLQERIVPSINMKNC